MATGIFGSGLGLGFIVTYVIGSIMVEYFGWRMGSLLSGAFISVVAAGTWIFLKDAEKPADDQKQSETSRGREGSMRTLLFLAIVNFSALSVLSGVLQFAPHFLALRFDFSTITGGFVTSLVGVMAIIASYAGGLGSVKIGGGYVVIVSMLMCAILPALLGFSY
jgi:predicted MFS family arabinose efflux permease